MNMTTKQVAAKVRDTLKVAAAHRGVVWSDGRQMALPDGLDFTVRATRTGVNIVISDRGWVDYVTAGDRAKIVEHAADRDAIVAEVDKIRDCWQPRLPGETKWAPIFISAKATSVEHIEYGH